MADALWFARVISGAPPKKIGYEQISTIRRNPTRQPEVSIGLVRCRVRCEYFDDLRDGLAVARD